jgi:multiple sugar transport system permease protein
VGDASLERDVKRGQPISRLVSPYDWHRRTTGLVLRLVQYLVLGLLVVFGAGPMYWMFKAAISSPAEITSEPLRLWPGQPRFGNLHDAVTSLHIGTYLLNSVLLALGCLVVQLVVSVGAGYALSVLRPRYGGVLYGMFLATLLVPATVSLVPLYLTVLHLPVLGVNLVNTFWAIWLPAGANAFNVLLVKRFFDGIPGEVYEAARIDGAGPLMLLIRIVLPMSRPVLAVVSLFTVIGSWKEFIWPLIALPDQNKQPLAVALPQIARTSDQGLLIAGLLVASIPPLLLFLFFQRQIVRGVGGDTGSKG